MTAIEERPCRACGMKIEFRIGPNGKPIPLQRVRSVYALQADGSLLKVCDEQAARGEPVYVSHFETCPKASSFSKPKTEARA